VDGSSASSIGWVTADTERMTGADNADLEVIHRAMDVLHVQLVRATPVHTCAGTGTVTTAR
jgi:hypothetical protein